jgi:hypothetical protein
MPTAYHGAMSDLPPPPGAPPPPPPHGSLPPGYVAYQAGGAAGVGPLAGVRKLAGGIVVLTALTALTGLAAPFVTAGLKGPAEDFLAGELSEDDFRGKYVALPAAQSLSGVLQLATAVVTMIWMYRMVSNCRRMQRRGVWAPLWAVFSWFLPPCVFVLPLLMLRELWKASDPDIPLGTDHWKQSAVPAILPIWWVLFGLVPLVLGLISGINQFSGGFSADTDAIAQNIIDTAGLSWATALVGIAAGAAYIVLVRQLTDRHARLTREP